jgi:hypothetical protein
MAHSDLIARHASGVVCGHIGLNGFVMFLWAYDVNGVSQEDRSEEDSRSDDVI